MENEVRHALIRTAFWVACFVLALAAATALVCGMTGCAVEEKSPDGALVVDENPPAPLQTRTYDMELEERPWKATKVYDATSGCSWWLLRRENSSSYIVLEGGGNVPVG